MPGKRSANKVLLQTKHLLLFKAFRAKQANRSARDSDAPDSQIEAAALSEKKRSLGLVERPTSVTFGSPRRSYEDPGDPTSDDFDDTDRFKENNVSTNPLNGTPDYYRELLHEFGPRTDRHTNGIDLALVANQKRSLLVGSFEDKDLAERVSREIGVKMGARVKYQRHEAEGLDYMLVGATTQRLIEVAGLKRIQVVRDFPTAGSRKGLLECYASDPEHEKGRELLDIVRFHLGRQLLGLYNKEDYLLEQILERREPGSGREIRRQRSLNPKRYSQQTRRAPSPAEDTAYAPEKSGRPADYKRYLSALGPRTDKYSNEPVLLIEKDGKSLLVGSWEQEADVSKCREIIREHTGYGTEHRTYDNERITYIHVFGPLTYVLVHGSSVDSLKQKLGIKDHQVVTDVPSTTHGRDVMDHYIFSPTSEEGKELYDLIRFHLAVNREGWFEDEFRFVHNLKNSKGNGASAQQIREVDQATNKRFGVEESPW